MRIGSVHESRRYVKLATGAVTAVLSLAAPALAHAELVPGTPGARDGLLAVAPDGTPQVAYVDAADTGVAVATRAAAGGWSSQQVPVPPGTLLGFDGHALLVESEDGTKLWLALAGDAGWHATRVATAPKGALLGLAGLATTAAGGHVVAYAVLHRDQSSTLRLVRQAPGGRLTTETVVAGFPKTQSPPSATPVVMPSGRIRVVESSDGQVVEWSHDPGGWGGQLLYMNAIGVAGGPTAAVAPPRAGVWSAWTELFDGYGESHVVVALRRERTYTAILSRHAFVVGITPDLEVAADDYVELPGNRLAFAGEILGLSGPPLELDGDLLGYAPDRGGRQYLLLDAGGLEWFRAAAPPVTRVTLTAGPDPAGIRLSGRVTPAPPGGGSVELWHETPAGPSLAATVPLAPDGSFTAVDAPTGAALTYRAVYRDPGSGLPVASLVRDVFGH